jgi:hypothetical protein
MPSADLKGASDARRAAGARSYYQHAHEVWLQQGGRALALHGVSPNEPSPADAIVSFQHEATTPLAGPVWTRPLVHALEDSGLSVYAVDGSYETAAFDGSMNPPFAYAKRFGQGQMVLLWLTSAARSRFLQVQQDSLTEQRVIRSGRLEPFAETVERALLLANCQPGAKHGTVRSDCPEPRGDADCVQQRVVEQLLQYNSVKNPYLLSAVLKHPGCSVEVTKDSGTARLWAVVPSSNHVELVPLRTGPTARGKHILTGAEEILRALAIGLSTVRVGAGK